MLPLGCSCYDGMCCIDIKARHPFVRDAWSVPMSVFVSVCRPGEYPYVNCSFLLVLSL